MEMEKDNSASQDEIRLEAIRRVDDRMRWRPNHPLEKEIYQIAVERADHLLREKAEEGQS